MFKTLVKILFPFIKKDSQPNYAYFEDSKKSVQEMQEEKITELHTSLNINSISQDSTEEKYQKAFYDYLFGQSPPTEQYDELSLYVADKVARLLLNPKDILKFLPILPTSLTHFIEELNHEQFDTEVLISLIQQDPVIAAKVIELANSPVYKRRDKDITDLKSAFMSLGANGLMEGVINGFISKLVPHSPIYFQQYGTKIWNHCLSTAMITKELITASPYKKDAPQGYLIGLICNLGDMVIYQLMMDAFSFVHPDCQPNSFAFKDVMLKNSKKLTYFIAKYWKFPDSITDALALQPELTQSSMLQSLFTTRPLACYIYEANILSELELRLTEHDISAACLNEAKYFLLSSPESKQYLDKLTHKLTLDVTPQV